MTDPDAALPADDAGRPLVVSDPDDRDLRHLSIAGGRYTILVSGEQTRGQYCLIEMLVPPDGGPPPHRHDFEEAFTLLEGELEFTFRGRTRTVAAPATLAIPANAPHRFRNASGSTVRMLCLCSPAGQDEFFAAIGVPVASRDAPEPAVDAEAQAGKRALAQALASRFHTEFLPA